VRWNIKNLRSKCEKKGMKHSSIDMRKVDHRRRQKNKNKSRERRNIRNFSKNIVARGHYLELKKNSISRMLLKSKKNVES
jgi:hypothetical protein